MVVESAPEGDIPNWAPEGDIPNAAKPQPRRMSKNSVLLPECGWKWLQPGGERREDAARFVAKFTNLIVAVLSCFDRVIFKGYLPITNGPALEGA